MSGSFLMDIKDTMELVLESMEFELPFLITAIALFMIHYAYKRERQLAALASNYQRHGPSVHPRKNQGDALWGRSNSPMGWSDSGSGSNRSANDRPVFQRGLFQSFRENQSAILAAFDQSYDVAIEMMREWAAANQTTLSPTNISTFMHRCSKTRRECPTDILVYLTQQAKVTPVPFASRALASTLYGLRFCTDSNEMQDFLGVMSTHMEKVEGAIEAHEIGQFLYGLHSVGPTPNVRKLMLAVVDKMLNGQLAMLDGQSVGSAIYGLRKCGGCDEFKKVLEAFTMHLRQQPDIVMIGQNYANALNGLNQASDSPELRDFVHELAYRLVESNIFLGPQEIGQACQGLVGIRDCEPVRMLLGALATRIEERNLILSAESVGNALCGLTRCGGSAEAAALVSAIAARISTRYDKYACHMVANVMVGLQKVPDSAEKRLIIGELAYRMNDAVPSGSQIAQCLFGLQNMSDCPEVRVFLRAYALKVDMSQATMSSNELAHALFGLNLCGGSVEARELLHVLQFKVQRGEQWTDPKSLEMALEGLIECGPHHETIQILSKLLVKTPEDAEGKLKDLRNDCQEMLELARENCASPNTSSERMEELKAVTMALAVAMAPEVVKQTPIVKVKNVDEENSEREGVDSQESTSTVFGLSGKRFSSGERSSVASSLSSLFTSDRPSAVSVSGTPESSTRASSCEDEEEKPKDNVSSLGRSFDTQKPSLLQRQKSRQLLVL